MNILVISDDFWHPGEVIVRGLKFLEKKGYTLDHVMAARDILDPEMIYDYDVIINAKSDQHSPANKDNPWFDPVVSACMPEHFEQYVKDGGCFIALHSGNAYHEKKTPTMTSFIGNEFINHPPQCDITVKKVLDHPVMEGVESFEIHDEHYMIRPTVSDMTVFMESTSDTVAGTQMAGYERKLGKGVMIVLTPGHTAKVFNNPSYQRVLENAINYGASFKK